MSDPALPIAVGWIARFEGFRADPYQDQAGHWTQGYGATYLPTMKPVTAATPPMSEPDARAWLQTIVAKTMAAVRGMVHAPITDHQAAAVCSLCYNEGTQAIRISSLMLALNRGHYQEAADAFLSWVYAASHVNAGLVQRRKQERALFLTPDVVPDSETGIPVTEQNQSVTRTAELSADDLNAAELARIHQE